MEQNNKEKVLTEAATSVQDKPETLQGDLSITELVMQVVRTTMEIIEAQKGDISFFLNLSDCGLEIHETHFLSRNGKTELTGRIEWVNVHISVERWGRDVVIDGLKSAAHTMNGVLRRVRKEAANEK